MGGRLITVLQHIYYYTVKYVDLQRVIWYNML